MNPRIVALLVPAVASWPLVARAQDQADLPVSAVVTAGKVSVISSLDKTSASVAEPVHLKLTVQAPEGSRIEWPTLDKKFGTLDLTHVTKSNDVPSVSGSNTREWVLQLTLESIKAGEVAVPSLDLRYATNSTSEFQSIQSSPLKIHISSVLEDRPDPTRFRDIKQTVDVPVAPEHSKTWMLWTGGAATAVALLLLAIAIKRRSRGVAPAAWALASIADIEQADLANANATSHFNEVVEIVREFLEVEFGVDALSQTTGEFFANAITELDLPTKTTERLKWLTTVADEIKFARLGIGKQHFEQAVAQAKAFIAECDQHCRTIAKGAA
ncbi:MAG TPA: hypothetical protein VH107_12640 [Lacipirellulaceae bacterium]|jgi:hypothetical protein|nr:hypothetical protein [Lacipirellulaceae bacterium]